MYVFLYNYYEALLALDHYESLFVSLLHHFVMILNQD